MSNKLVKPKNNDFVIDDGIEVYNIKNKHGKMLGQFIFRPSDTNIVDRYEEVVEFFNNYKVPEGSENAEIAKDFEKEMVDKISYLIGADAQEAFFSIFGAFSPLASGELFIENVLNAVSSVIEREMAVRTKKVQRRMNKYVAKYHK